MTAPAQTLVHQQPSGPGNIDSIDPATGDVIARFEAARLGDLPAVFERARAAQKKWAA